MRPGSHRSVHRQRFSGAMPFGAGGRGGDPLTHLWFGRGTTVTFAAVVATDPGSAIWCPAKSRKYKAVVVQHTISFVAPSRCPRGCGGIHSSQACTFVTGFYQIHFRS